MKTIQYLIAISLIVLQGCKKHTDPNPPLSTKSISTVTFTVADNPRLSSEITASIIGDSVKILFPSNVNLNGLIPTITHNGNSISPASNTPQNFSSPINYSVTAEDGSSKNYTFYGRQMTMNDSISMMSGRWQVVKDSVAVLSFCYSCSGGPCWIPIPGVWIGAATDYWDFKTTTLLEQKYGGNVLSGSYQFVPGHIMMPNTCLPHYFKILKLNSSEVELYFTHTNQNGGYWNRMVWLKR